MSCDYPIAAWLKAVPNPSGKRSFQFKPQGSLSGIPQYLPCGKCVGCRLERSRVWAVRCVHESKMHRENCFITLTYDNDHLPASGSLSVSTLQLFMKRFRMWAFRKYGVLIRHYACGEYGDLNKRPHYHAIIFGFDFRDKLLYSTSPAGDSIFSSADLDGVWGLGSTKVGDVNFRTAAYVARYCMKKVDGKQRDAGHYVVYDMNGELHDRVPEFAIMSRRPGIAASYYEKFGKEIRDHDSVILDYREVPSVRYYDKLFDKLDAGGLLRLKRKRHPVAKFGREVFLRESSPQRMRDKARLKELLLKQKARNL